MNQTLKHFVEKTLGCRIYRNSLPRGLDVFADLDRAYGLRNFQTVFDVGANVGQSAVEYLREFSGARIFSFEPVGASYQALRQAVGGNPRMHTHHAAVGATRGRTRIHVAPDSRESSVTTAKPGATTEEIAVETVADFCRENKVAFVDFLKIDTEGHELQVLEGAGPLLQEHKIGLIYIECAPAQTEHFVPFGSLYDLLQKSRYDCFGIYEQTPNWDGQKHLRFFNALFVCRELADSQINPANYSQYRQKLAGESKG